MSFKKNLSYKAFYKSKFNIIKPVNDKIDKVRGLNITIVTTSKTDDEAYELLKSFGFPLKEKPVKNNVEEAA